jgi:hypothetical protein
VDPCCRGEGGLLDSSTRLLVRRVTSLSHPNPHSCFPSDWAMPIRHDGSSLAGGTSAACSTESTVPLAVVSCAGIYHRFCLDGGLAARTLRLFVEEAVWVAVNRDHDSDDHPVRRTYLEDRRGPSQSA